MNDKRFLSLVFYAVTAECGAPIGDRNMNRLYERTQTTQNALGHIESRLLEMGVRIEDDFMNEVCELVEEFERQGFINGFRMGMMLQGDLTGGAAVQNWRGNSDMSKKNSALMDDLMDCITQVDEWQEIQANDPLIAAADARWDATLEKAGAILPRELYAELSDAHASRLSAMGDAGILFGIHVADAIRDVASRPADLSRHILKRMEGRT